MKLLHAGTQSLLLIANNVLDMAALAAGSFFISNCEFNLKQLRFSEGGLLVLIVSDCWSRSALLLMLQPQPKVVSTAL